MIFSFFRLFAYVLLGLVAGFSGMLLADFLQTPGFGSYLWISAGAFIYLLGILVTLGRELPFHFYQALSQRTVNDSTWSMALLGFIVSMAPCAIQIDSVEKEPLFHMLPRTTQCGYDHEGMDRPLPQ